MKKIDKVTYWLGIIVSSLFLFTSIGLSSYFFHSSLSYSTSKSFFYDVIKLWFFFISMGTILNLILNRVIFAKFGNFLRYFYVNFIVVNIFFLIYWILNPYLKNIKTFLFISTGISVLINEIMFWYLSKKTIQTRAIQNVYLNKKKLWIIGSINSLLFFSLILIYYKWSFLDGFILILVSFIISFGITLLKNRLFHIKSNMFINFLIFTGIALILMIFFFKVIFFSLPNLVIILLTLSHLLLFFEFYGGDIAKKEKKETQDGKTLEKKITIALVFLNQKIKEKMKFLPKIKKNHVRYIIEALLILFIGGIVLNSLKTRIMKWYPNNFSERKTTIFIKLSKPIIIDKNIIDMPKYIFQTNNDSNHIPIKEGIEFFKIKPEIKGTYQFESSDGKYIDMIRFIPEEPLKPSTKYKVKVLVSKIKHKGLWLAPKTFSFIAVPFRISSIRPFYNYDLLKNIEKELVIELNFTSPVAIGQLRQNLKVNWESNPIDYQLAPSNLPTRFYIKIKKIKRKWNKSFFSIKINKDLMPIEGELGLKSDYNYTIPLPATIKLKVESVNSFPVVDNTYLAIRFNKPVSKNMIRRHVSITKDNKNDNKELVPIFYKIETEYCYAILKANFHPNEKYKLIIDDALRAKTGEEMIEPFKTTFQIRDKRPEVNFLDSGHILSPKGNMAIRLYTLNLDMFTIRVDKIYKENLITYLQNGFNSYIGDHLIDTRISVTNGKLNQKVPFYINFNELYKEKYKGLYRISISDTRDYYNRNRKTFLATDIGLIAKTSGDDLIVMTYSIQHLTPLSGVSIKIVASKNQVLQKRISNETGKIIFKDWKKEKFTPYVLIAEKGDDFSYLKFNADQINASRFNIGGKVLDKGLQAFLTPERGVYRPGDTAYVTAIIRNNDLSLPPAMNVQLKIIDPRGAIFKIIRKKIPHSGMVVIPIKFSSYVKTGTYHLRLNLNNQITLGRTTLKVEDFIPDKIKAIIVAKTKHHQYGKPIVFTVKANQLFGPPASGAKIMTELVWSSREFYLPQFKNYIFNNSQNRDYQSSQSLGEDSLDEKGEKKYSINVPTGIQPPSALNMKIYTEVFDSGGRPVSAVKTIPVNPYPVYFGLKIQEKDVYLKKEPVRISYISITGQGKYVKSTNVELLIKKRTYYTILKKYKWLKSHYESSSYEEVYVHKMIKINGKGSFVFTPRTSGTYFVSLGDQKNMKTVAQFYVQGRGIEASDLENANNLIIKFNKKKYNVGDIATINILSPFDGRLFFYLEREKIFYSKIINLQDKKATLQIPITVNYTPNVYVSALVVRKPERKLQHLPMSSFSIRNLEIKAGPRKIKIALNSLNKIRSKNGLTVNGTLSSFSPNSRFVLFAVDEGILQITQFQTPDPFNFFYKKRALLNTMYSIFDYVLPNVKGRGVAIGGGDEEDISRRHINPIKAKRVHSVSLYSPVLQPDSTGHFSYHFNVPDFNGKLRLMAIAADNKSFGSKEKFITVSDPIVVIPNLPRFLAIGDSFVIPVEVFNKTGKKGTFNIYLSVTGPVKVIGKIKQTITLLPDAQQKIYFSCKTTMNAGKAMFQFKAIGNNEESTSKKELPVRPARPLTTSTKIGTIQPNESISIQVPAGFIPFGQKIRFFLSNSKITKFLRSFDYLIHYPYGCAEQTTSALYPMIYYKKIVDQFQLVKIKRKSLNYFINAGIKKLEKMQMPDGRFSYWSGGDYCNEYASDYASRFLIEASSLGYNVDQNVLDKIYEHFKLVPNKKKTRKKLDRRYVSPEKNSSSEKSISDLYLFALAGYPDVESMEYYRNKEFKNLDFENKCLLASTYSLIGNKKIAKEILPDKPTFSSFQNLLGGNFDSYVRRLAIYLIAMMDIDPKNSQKEKIIDLIIKQSINGHFGSTINNSFALRAIGKVYSTKPVRKLKVDYLINDKFVKTLNAEHFVISDVELSGKKITIKNLNNTSLYFSLLAEGTFRTNQVQPVSIGFGLKKEYFNANGQPLNFKNVHQGDLVVVTISIIPDKRVLNNLVVVDLLPAGLEIENVRIRSHGKLNFSPKHNWTPRYQDIRDDRILLFSGSISRSVSFSYVTRAVTEGEFVVPQIYGEAMYDTKIHAVGNLVDKMIIKR